MPLGLYHGISDTSVLYLWKEFLEEIFYMRIIINFSESHFFELQREGNDQSSYTKG